MCETLHRVVAFIRLSAGGCLTKLLFHDDVTVWKDFLHYWPFGRGIHHSLVDSLHKGPVMQSFHSFVVRLKMSRWTKCWVAGDLWCHEYHVIWLSLLGLVFCDDRQNGSCQLFYWWTKNSKYFKSLLYYKSKAPWPLHAKTTHSKTCFSMVKTKSNIFRFQPTTSMS